MQDMGHLLGNRCGRRLRAIKHAADVVGGAGGVDGRGQIGQGGQRPALVCLEFHGLAVDKALHLGGAAGVGHGLAFGAAQQQGIASVAAMDSAYSGWV